MLLSLPGLFYIGQLHGAVKTCDTSGGILLDTWECVNTTKLPYCIRGAQVHPDPHRQSIPPEILNPE